LKADTFLLSCTLCYILIICCIISFSKKWKTSIW